MIITEAAVLQNGLVWRGRRHSDCFKKMIDSGVDLKGSVQGFVTDNDQFVDRKRAFTIALKANQVKKGKKGCPRILVSEDLY